MGKMIMVGFFILSAMNLAILGYVTGKYNTLDEMEEVYEQKENEKNRETAIFDGVCYRDRKFKRIDYNLREIRG